MPAVSALKKVRQLDLNFKVNMSYPTTNNNNIIINNSQLACEQDTLEPFSHILVCISSTFAP